MPRPRMLSYGLGASLAVSSPGLLEGPGGKADASSHNDYFFGLHMSSKLQSQFKRPLFYTVVECENDWKKGICKDRSGTAFSVSRVAR